MSWCFHLILAALVPAQEAPPEESPARDEATTQTRPFFPFCGPEWNTAGCPPIEGTFQWHGIEREPLEFHPEQWGTGVANSPGGISGDNTPGGISGDNTPGGIRGP